MNLKTYLETNGREVGDLTNLFSVGAVLDTVSGDTFPMLPGEAIGFDESMNLMEMDISDDSFDWYNSLANGDKKVVDEVMDDLAYFNYVFGDKEDSKCLTPPNIGSKCLTPPNIGRDK